MLSNLVVALVVLVYSALQTDLARKCKAKDAVPAGQLNLLQYTNVTMLVLASVAVLYLGYQMAVPSEYKSLAANYF